MTLVLRNLTRRPIHDRVRKTFCDLLVRMETGTLVIHWPDGRTDTFVGRLSDLPRAELVVNRERAFVRLLLGGNMGFMEAYLDGDWDSPDPAKVIELGAANRQSVPTHELGATLMRLKNRVLHLLRPNTRAGARRNISYHYDLGNTFYSKWLDDTMTYSAALFDDADPRVTALETAQDAKYAAIQDSAGVSSGDRVLEIGCGWGGFAEAAASSGAHVTGLTISREQYDFARNRLSDAGLDQVTDIRFEDYRDTRGVWDRIVSIEMFEAVGEKNWPTYFDVVRRRLAKNGAAALQIITIDDTVFETYRRSSDYIQKYIFPGGMLPSVSRLREEAESAAMGFEVRRMFGQCYAETLQHWRERFLAAWPEIKPLGFDDRFKRMWELYLAYCEGGFRAGTINVGHFRLTT